MRDMDKKKIFKKIIAGIILALMVMPIFATVIIQIVAA